MTAIRTKTTLTKLLFALLLSCSAMKCLAYDFKTGNICYNILSRSENSVEVTHGGLNDTYSGEITIPSSIEYEGTTYTVTEIRPETFWGCTGLTSITIPATVSSIEDYTFYGCSGLKEIKLPETLTGIGNYTFYGCCSLNSIRIPDSVTVLGKSAFEKSGLQQAIIGKGITAISECTFRLCSSLTEITIPDNVTSIDHAAFEFCTKLTGIELGKNLYSIGECAFMGCSMLDEIRFPDKLARIGALAFEGCSNLSSINIPCNVSYIGESAFDGCSGFTSIIVDKSNKSYSSKGCAIIECDENRLVHGCRNTVIPEGVTSIGKWAFYNCSEPANIIMPESISSIDEWAFFKCTGLTGIVIPCNTTRIGKYAFYQCNRLADITLPENMESIGDGAFSDCKNIVRIYAHGKQPASIGSNTFDSIYDTANLYVPAGAKEFYRSAPYWSNFTNIIEQDFDQNNGIESVTGESNTLSPVYDLLGRKTEQTFKGGIYIRNGKVVLYRE